MRTKCVVNNLCIWFGTWKVRRLNQSRFKVDPKSKFPAGLGGKNGLAATQRKHAPLPYQFASSSKFGGQARRRRKNFERSLQRFDGETSSHFWTSSHIWIAGDMNLPGFDWKHNCLFLTCRFPELTRKFTDCLDNHGWVQLITNPTRGKNVVDLLITNNDSPIIKTQVIPGISDHDAVFVEGNIKATITKQNAGCLNM